MEGLFTIDSLFTLLMLVLLQVVLGFDNLLYISLESRKAPVENQSHVRKLGVGLAIVLRIVLLFVLMSLIQFFQEPFASLHDNNYIEFSFNVHSVIVLLGGIGSYPLLIRVHIATNVLIFEIILTSAFCV